MQWYESDSSMNEEEAKIGQTSDDEVLESFTYNDWKKQPMSLRTNYRKILERPNTCTYVKNCEHENRCSRRIMSNIIIKIDIII